MGQNRPADSGPGIRLIDVSKGQNNNNAIGYGSDGDGKNSTTRSGINTRNIHITDEAGQLARTGRTTEETEARIYTGIDTETADQHSGRLKNSFDKDAVAKEIDLQREVTQEFGGTLQGLNTEIERSLDGLKEKLAKGEIDRKEYEDGLKVRQRGKVLLNMIGAGLSAPTDSAAGIAAATAAPAISYGIGQEFKKHNKEGSATHIASHMALGAVVSALGGNDAVSGALAAGGAEALVPLFSQAMYGTTDPEKLTAEDKQNLSNMARLFGAAVGAATSNGTANGYANVAQGGMNAGNTVENNYLKKPQMYAYADSLRKICVPGNEKACQKVIETYGVVDKLNTEKLIRTCSQGTQPNRACADSIGEARGGDEVIYSERNNQNDPFIVNSAMWGGERLEDLCQGNKICIAALEKQDRINIRDKNFNSEKFSAESAARIRKIPGLGVATQGMTNNDAINFGVNIESLQDTADYRSRQQNISAQVTVGYGASASGDYSQSKINAEHRSVSEQSGLFAGEDGFDVQVSGHTNLTGGIITSTQSAEAQGKNRFQSGSISQTDLHNISKYDGSSIGFGASVALSGESLGQGQQNNSKFTTVADQNSQGLNGVGYGRDSDHQDSTTHSGIGTRNIILTDENGQLAKTDYGTDKAAQLAYTDIRTEDASQQSGSLKNQFDADKVQNELDLQRDVSQQFSQTVGTAQGMLNEKIDALKQQHKAGDITEADYAEKLKQLQHSQVFLNMVAAALSAPTDSAAGIAAATASPALSYQIGQYFKGLAQENPDGRLTAGQETAHILAHGVLGAAVSAAGGNDALAGALASGGAEAAAPVIGKWLYGKDDGGSLSAEEKETVSAITRMLGTTAGAAVGNSAADAVRGGMAGQNAVENNHLREGQRIQKNAEFRACKADWRCEFDVDEKWEKIGLNNMKELYAVCDKGINTAACQNLRNQIDRSTYQGKRDYNYPTGLELKGELSGALGVGVQANGKVTVTLGNRGSSVQAEGGVGLGIGAALSGGLSKQTRHVGIDENKTLNASTEIVLGEKQFGTQADNKNATLSTKVEGEIKLGPWNNSAAIQGGRQYPDNQASSLYRGGEVKSVVKPQLGIGGMLKWDIWNGRSKRYEKIR